MVLKTWVRFPPPPPFLLRNKMKAVVILSIGALLFVASGCSSTMTLGRKANEKKCLNVSAGWDHASVTLPLVKVGTKLND